MKREELIESIKTFEGWRSNAYKDSGGTWTIGWGRIEGVKSGDITTKERENDWIERKIDGIENEVLKRMTAWGYSINDNQLFALIDFVYNLGIGNLTKLTDNGTRSLDTIGDKIPLYCTCKGITLNGLIKRRAWEQNLYKTYGSTNYTAKDLQRFTNSIISSKGFSTSKIDEDGIIGQKTINALCEVLQKIML